MMVRKNVPLPKPACSGSQLLCSLFECSNRGIQTCPEACLGCPKASGCEEITRRLEETGSDWKGMLDAYFRKHVPPLPQDVLALVPASDVQVFHSDTGGGAFDGQTLVESIGRFGMLTPATGFLLRSGKVRIAQGHHRVSAAKKAGLREIPVILTSRRGIEVERAALEVARCRQAATPEARRAAEARLEAIHALAGEPAPVGVGEHTLVVALAMRLARLAALAEASEETVEMLTGVVLEERDSGALSSNEAFRLGERLQTMAYVLSDAAEALTSHQEKQEAFRRLQELARR